MPVLCDDHIAGNRIGHAINLNSMTTKLVAWATENEFRQMDLVICVCLIVQNRNNPQRFLDSHAGDDLIPLDSLLNSKLQNSCNKCSAK